MPWRLARFLGYSSLCIARGLAEGGSLLSCDISEAWTAIGVQAWEEAGLRDRIELRIAPAPKTLRRLPHQEDIDLVFIDADKTGYPDYWKELVHRVRPGGVLLIDNVLWSGRVVDPGSPSRAVRPLSVGERLRQADAAEPSHPRQRPRGHSQMGNRAATSGSVAGQVVHPWARMSA